MKNLQRFFLAFAALAAAAAAYIVLAGDDTAWAQISRTIRIVVPYAPGGTADIVARLVADQAGTGPGPAVRSAPRLRRAPRRMARRCSWSPPRF